MDASRAAGGDSERGARRSSSTRREFLGAAAGAALTFVAGRAGRSSRDATAADSASSATEPPLARKLPRWRGFNLLEKFTLGRNRPYVERDFEWMSRWGFDFARLPMEYRCWTDPARPDALECERGEKVLKHLDEAVDFGNRHGIHVNFNLHRAPGYCVNPPKERLDLWIDPEAIDAFAAQWRLLAGRYTGIPSERVSFDLLNEPPDIEEPAYAHAARAAIEAILAEDPHRLIVVDGLWWGREPVESLAGLGIAQSTRGYDPMRVSHHGAPWVGGENWPKPSWPLVERDGAVYDKERLRRERIEPWKALEKKGVGVHVGEWGAYRECPRTMALAWMRDFLDLWKEAGWGLALWNLRGSASTVLHRAGGEQEPEKRGRFHDAPHAGRESPTSTPVITQQAETGPGGGCSPFANRSDGRSASAPTSPAGSRPDEPGGSADRCRGPPEQAACATMAVR